MRYMQVGDAAALAQERLAVSRLEYQLGRGREARDGRPLDRDLEVRRDQRSLSNGKLAKQRAVQRQSNLPPRGVSRIEEAGDPQTAKAPSRAIRTRRHPSGGTGDA